MYSYRKGLYFIIYLLFPVSVAHMSRTVHLIRFTLDMCCSGAKEAPCWIWCDQDNDNWFELHWTLSEQVNGSLCSSGGFRVQWLVFALLRLNYRRSLLQFQKEKLQPVSPQARTHSPSLTGVVRAGAALLNVAVINAPRVARPPPPRATRRCSVLLFPRLPAAEHRPTPRHTAEQHPGTFDFLSRWNITLWFPVLTFKRREARRRGVLIRAA